jgi:hypothetical protein
MKLAACHLGLQQCGHCRLLLDELAEQALGGLLVAPAVDENIENEAGLVDGTPEPMLLPGETDDELIEVPFVATTRRSPTGPGLHDPRRPPRQITQWKE